MTSALHFHKITYVNAMWKSSFTLLAFEYILIPMMSYQVSLHICFLWKFSFSLVTFGYLFWSINFNMHFQYMVIKQFCSALLKSIRVLLCEFVDMIFQLIALWAPWVTFLVIIWLPLVWMCTCCFKLWFCEHFTLYSWHGWDDRIWQVSQIILYLFN